ncbi:hypothetical protein J1614_000764, partial [Plenodomus biglobosus]
MATVPPSTPITEDELVYTNAAFLTLTSLFVLARAVLHIWKRRSFELPDFFIYLAYALFVSLWSCYFIVTPPMFRVYAVVGGQAKPYATMMEDAAKMLRFITAGQMCFYTLLFSVKMSLLTFYRKLLAGLPTIYKKIWFGVMFFCILAWLGSALSSVFTCNDLHEKFSKGRCGGTPNENQRIIFSLYFAYSVDVVTDFAIMFLPIRLTWNLQMPRKQKVGVFFLFGSALICIAFATLRVVKLGVDGHGNATTPEPKWLLLWTVLECSMAILIGCSPAFAILIRKRINTQRSPYNAEGYIKQPTDEVKLKDISSSGSGPKPTLNDGYWDDTHSSQEELAGNSHKTLMTTNLRMSDEIVGHAS